MREAFHVGLGPQLMHHNIICSQAVTQEFGQLPEILANKYYGGVAKILNPSTHPQHGNVPKHLVYV